MHGSAERKNRSDTAAPIATRRLVVLVVDDDEDVRRLLVRLLCKAGYITYEAADPLEACRRFERGHELLDVLLTDMTMPGMSGTALADRLRAQRPALVVVLMSGYADDLPETRLRAGVVSLAKPFCSATLLSALAELLARSPRSAPLARWAGT